MSKEMAANSGHDGTQPGTIECQTSGGLPVLNVAGTTVGIRILVQEQQHAQSQQLATQLGGVLSNQRVLANTCTNPAVSLSLCLSLSESLSLSLSLTPFLIQTSALIHHNKSPTSDRENVSCIGLFQLISVHPH